jgi:2-dehydropantoate 2-reductase
MLKEKVQRMPRIQFAVFGVGAVGGYFGAALARAGHSVAFIARGAQLDAIRSVGLHISTPNGASPNGGTPNGNFSVAPAQATDDPAEVGPVDAVILGVKAWQVTEAAHRMRPLIAAATKVLPLQNGVEAADQLAAVLGPQHPLLGLCLIMSSVTAPGHIRHAGMAPTIVLGEPDGSAFSANGQALADALRGAGVVVKTPADVQAALWEKLIFIASASGVGAVSRSTVGEVRDCPQARQLLQQLIEEVVAVARARGVRLSDDVVARTVALVESMPASGTTSMQRDIVDGRPSELEQIIGAVIRLGEERKVRTPAMEYIYAALMPQELKARRVTQDRAGSR